LKQQKNYTDLINSGESSLIEFKSTLRVDLTTKKPERFIEHTVLKTIAAFLNTKVGTLLIGVEDNKNIIGLETDFNSFSKGDKLDEFRKHLDNLIANSIGNRFHRYIDIDFVEIESKRVCIIAIEEKSSEPVYIVDSGLEKFYIRRSASTIDLKPSEAVKYIQEHWYQTSLQSNFVNPIDKFSSKENFQKELNTLISQKDSAYYTELKEHWNSHSLLNDFPFLNEVLKEFLPKSIDYGLLLVISDSVNKHLYYDKDAKYIYNQPHIYMHNSQDEGYNLPLFYHINFIGILYATAIRNKIDIDTISHNYKNMQSIYSGMIGGIIDNLTTDGVDNLKEYPTNYHWLIGEIFGITNNWLHQFNEKENFVKTSSYLDFIPFNIRLCLSELYRGEQKKKIAKKFVVSQCYYGVLTQYFSPLLNNSLRSSIEENIIADIPNDFVEPILEFSLDEAFATSYENFCEGKSRVTNLKEREIMNRLRNFLIANNKI